MVRVDYFWEDHFFGDRLATKHQHSRFVNEYEVRLAEPAVGFAP